jgi:hypothetical protein
VKVLWKRDLGLLSYDDAERKLITIPVSGLVRNELNGLRKFSEVPVHVTNKDGSPGPAYMPRPFPKGLWRITRVKDTRDQGGYLSPAAVQTDAHQRVQTWTEVHSEDDGHTAQYGVLTEEWVEDYFYELHDSTSMYTLGCGRHNTENLCPDRIPGTHETIEGRAFRIAVEQALTVEKTIPLEVV